MDDFRYNNIREIINDCTKKYANNNAFIVKNKDKSFRKITYKEFGEDINRLGTAFLKLELKDKKIAIIGKNRYEWAIGYYAVVNGLATVVPLDKGLPEDEIENSVKITEADAIIFEEKYYNEIQNIIKRKTTNLTTLICMDDIENKDVYCIENLLKIGKEELEKGNNEYSKLKINDRETKILLFTSGTTSIAKAVELSHKNIASNINSLHAHEIIYDTDVNMAFLPFHHTFGSTGLLFFLSEGTTTVFCDGIRHIQQNLKEYRVTIFFCVPLIIEAMHKKIMQGIEKQGKMRKVEFARKLSRFLLKFKIDIRRKLFKEIIDNLGGGIRFVISGAAPIDEQVAVDFNDFGILTVQGYGLTETSPVLAAENDDNMRKGSIGKPMPHVQLKIDNPNEEGIGEIVVKGENIMNGYYKNKEATNAVLKDGWFYTGDLARIDKDGFIFISGRKKNVIVLKNGKNVYPEELEIIISNLPYVVENIVFGIPKEDDYILGTKIVYNKDYIIEKYGDISNEELQEKIWQDIKKINQNLCNYKHITNLIITDEPMLKTATGKTKRQEEIEKCLKTL